MPIVRISLLEGRGTDDKRALIAAVTNAVTDTLAVAPERVRVLIDELPASNWGVAGTTKEDGA